MSNPTISLPNLINQLDTADVEGINDNDADTDKDGILSKSELLKQRMIKYDTMKKIAIKTIVNIADRYKTGKITDTDLIIISEEGLKEILTLNSPPASAKSWKDKLLQAFAKSAPWIAGILPFVIYKIMGM